jgi:hypothetical protein
MTLSLAVYPHPLCDGWRGLPLHPLSPAYIDHSHALGEAVKKKEKQYDTMIAPDHDEERWRESCWPPEGDLFALCLHLSCQVGGLSEHVVKFLNGAAGFVKACETAATLRRFRDDGLTPQLLSRAASVKGY